MHEERTKQKQHPTRLRRVKLQMRNEKRKPDKEPVNQPHRKLV